MHLEILGDRITHPFEIPNTETRSPQTWFLIWDDQDRAVVNFGINTFVVDIHPWGIVYRGSLCDLYGAANPWPYQQNHEPISWMPTTHVSQADLMDIGLSRMIDQANQARALPRMMAPPLTVRELHRKRPIVP